MAYCITNQEALQTQHGSSSFSMSGGNEEDHGNNEIGDATATGYDTIVDGWLEHFETPSESKDAKNLKTKSRHEVQVAERNSDSDDDTFVWR